MLHQNIPRETDGAIRNDDIVEEFIKKKKKKFEGTSQWSLNDRIFHPTKRRRSQEKGFNIACILTPPDTFVFQCNSECIAFDTELQDNVLLPKGFTEYIYTSGKSN